MPLSLYQWEINFEIFFFAHANKSHLTCWAALYSAQWCVKLLESLGLCAKIRWKASLGPGTDHFLSDLIVHFSSTTHPGLDVAWRKGFFLLRKFLSTLRNNLQKTNVQ